MADELNENNATEDGELSDEQLEQAAGGLSGACSGTSDKTGDKSLESMEGIEDEDEFKDPTKSFELPLAGFEDPKG